MNPRGDVDRLRLEAVVRNRNAPHKHVWQAHIVLLSGDGLGTNSIMRETGKDRAVRAAIREVCAKIFFLQSTPPT